MFVVLADSRTGSHLLKSLLNSHPQLRCYDEILGLRKAERDFYTLGHNEGCLVSYVNLTEGEPLAEGNDIRRIMGIIRKCKVIHLTRDLEDRAKSQLFYSKAKKKRPVFLKANLEKDQKFDPKLDEHDQQEIDRLVSKFRELQRNCLMQLWDVRTSWLELTYEWLCGDRQLKTLPHDKAETICRYLQVPVTTMNTNLYKIRKFGD